MVEMTWANFCSALGTEVTDVVTETNADAEDGIRIDGTTAYIKGIKITDSATVHDDGTSFFPAQIINADLKGININSMKHTKGMFQLLPNLKTLDIRGIGTPVYSTNTSNNIVTVESDFFSICGGCTSLEEVKLDFSFTFDELKTDENTIIENKINLKGLFQDCTSLKSVDLSECVFPENYTSKLISFENAFLNCTNLESVNLSNVKANYTYCMFDKCESLTEVITNENSLISLSSYTFRNCKSLESIDLSNFSFFDTKCEYSFAGGSYFICNSQGIFTDCINLKNITITKVNYPYIKITPSLYFKKYMVRLYYTFTNTSIENLDFLLAFTMKEQPNNEIKIVLDSFSNTFANCKKLNDISALGEFEYPFYLFSYAFYNCESLTTVDLPNLKIYNSDGKGAGCESMFEGCTSLEYVNLKSLHYCTKARESLTSSKRYYYTGKMFKNCENLRYVDISEWGRGYTDINEYSNITCSDLSLEDEMFYDCINLQEVHLEYACLREQLYYSNGNYTPAKTNAFEGTSAVIFVNPYHLDGFVGGGMTLQAVKNAIENSDCEIRVNSYPRYDLYEKLKDATEIRSDTTYANKGKMWTDEDGVLYLNDIHVFDLWDNTCDVDNLTGSSFSFIPSNIEKIDLTQLNISHLRTLQNSIYYSEDEEPKLKELDVSNWELDFNDVCYDVNVNNFFYPITMSTIGKYKSKPFSYAESFIGIDTRKYSTQLKHIIGLDTWNLEGITDISSMFANNSGLEDVGDLSNWNTSDVTDMSGLFSNCKSITTDKLSFIENWNTSNVTDMSYMFNQCRNLQSLSFIENLDTSKVTSLYSTFYYTSADETAFDLDLSNWNTSSVTSMGSAFCGSNFSSINLTGWNPKLKGDNKEMFYLCNAGTITGIDDFEFEEDVVIDSMFGVCKNLISISDLSNWNTLNIISMKYVFSSCDVLTSIGDLSNWNTSNVTDMIRMFSSCKVLTSIGDLSEWNTSNVTDMRGMFENCNTFTSLGDLSEWNTENVTEMEYMFKGCKLLSEETLNSVNGWDISKVKTLSYMFSECEQLTKIKLDNWVGEEVTSIYSIFANCVNLKYIDLRSLTTAKTKSLTNMFKNCDNPVVNMHSATFESMTPMNKSIMKSSTSDVDDCIDGDYSVKEIDLSSFNFDFTSVKYDVTSNQCTYYTVANFLIYVAGVKKFPTLVFTSNTSLITFINKIKDMIKNKSYPPNFNEYPKSIVSRVSIVQGVDSTLDTIKVTDVFEKLNECEETYEIAKKAYNKSKIKEVLGVDDYDSYCFKIENELPEEASEVWQLPIYLDNYTPTEEEQTKFGVEDKIILNGAMYVHNYPVTETGLATSTGSLDVSFNFNDESTLTPIFKSSEESGMFNTVRSINLNGMIPQNMNDFRGLFAYSFNDKAELDISEWDLTLPSTLDDEEESNPTYIQGMFEGSKLTSIDVSFLNGCEITTLERAFAYCPNLTEITGMENLDMSKVTDFNKAFCSSPKLANLDLSSFDVSSATTFDNTFANDNLGTQDVSSWDVSNVTSMGSMFLNSTGNITGFTEWNTENVKNFSFMFSYYKQDKLSISGFNFENKRDTRSMFSDSKIGTLDITYITLPKSKFNTCTFEGYTNPDDEDDYYPKKMYITEWNTRYTPLSETSIEHPLLFNDDVFRGLKCRMYYGEKWAGEKEPTTYGGADIKWIKYGYYFKNVVSAIKEYEDIEHITCKDEIEEGIHNDDDTKSLNINVWIQDDGSSDVAFSNLPTTLKTVDIKGLSHFNLVTSMKEMFKDCTQLTSVKFGAIDVSSVTTMESMFENCPLLEETVGLEYFNTESLENVSKAFKGCEVLPPQDFSEWDMSKITDMSYMLEGNQQINDYSLTGWNLPKLESMKGFFKSCHNLERLYLMGGEDEQMLQFSSELDESADVSYLFEDCTSLTWDSIDALSVLVFNNTAYDLTGLFKDCTSITDFHFDTDNEDCSIAMYNVHTLDYMFEGCTGLTTVNCSNLIGSITEHEEGIDYDTVNLKGLFKNCSNLTEVTDVNDWYTFNFKTIDELFSGTAIEELDIGNWTCDNITSCSGMFANCSNLSKMYLIGWNSGVDVDTEDMFENCDGTKLYISEGWIYGHSRTFGNAVSLTFMMKCTPPRLYLDGYEIKIIKDIKTFNENSSIAPIGEVKIITQSSDTINISVACSTSANDVLEIIPLAETNVSFANYEDYFETINLKKYDYIRLIGDGAGHWLLQDYQSRNTAGMKETVIKYCGEIGELRFFPTSEYRYGYLFCDGSTFDKDIYDEFFILWKKYFEKDCGYDRFGNPKLPDFTDGRYICGSNSCESPYKKIEAGLPNIKGWWYSSSEWGYSDGTLVTTENYDIRNEGKSSPGKRYTLDVNRINKIFGKSDTVTPKSIKMHIFIKVI